MPAAIREVLRLSLYQLIFTAHPAYAVVNEAVDLTKTVSIGAYLVSSTGCSGTISGGDKNWNRLCPTLLRTPWVDLTIVHSHPRWLVQRWIQRWGEETTHRLVEANNAPAPLSVRTNTLRISRDELLGALAKAGIEAEPVPTIPEAIRLKSGRELTSNPLWVEGYFYIQDEASMLGCAPFWPRNPVP